MLSKRVHDILYEIAKATYPEMPEEKLKFWIDVIPKEQRTFHGDYNSKNRAIRIFNLSRPTKHIVKTSIHELAHHIDYMKNGTSDHSPRFYEIYKQLMLTAIKSDIIAISDLEDESETIGRGTDIKKILKMIKEESEEVLNEKLELFNDKVIVKVLNAFDIKDTLKINGYKWNSIELVWEKTIAKKDKDIEKGCLLVLTDEENIQIVNMTEESYEAIYYIAIDGGYDSRELLKENGYRWKGYNINIKSWIKKIKASDLDKEKQFLRENVLEAKLTNKKSKKSSDSGTSKKPTKKKTRRRKPRKAF